jgi:hypothetical protein
LPTFRVVVVVTTATSPSRPGAGAISSGFDERLPDPIDGCHAPSAKSSSVAIRRYCRSSDVVV